MKKNKIFSIIVVCALLSALSASVGAKPVDSDDRTSAVLSFVSLGVVTFGIQKGGDLVKLSTATKGIMHTANVLLQLGVIASKPVLKDLGMRALIGGVSAKVGMDPMMDQALPSIPFVGQSLKDSGNMGKGLTTIVFYQLAGKLYEEAKEKTRLGKLIDN